MYFNWCAVSCDIQVFCSRNVLITFYLAFLHFLVEGLAEDAYIPGPKVNLCHYVYPNPSYSHHFLSQNCSIVCSNSFHHFLANTEGNEVTLCAANLSALSCRTHAECKQYHVGAICKNIPCLCKHNNMSRSMYILDPNNQKPYLSTCVVSTRWIDPELPVVPFPWKTLLVVCAVIISLLACLVAVRWVTPFIRELQVKHLTRNRNTGNTVEAEVDLCSQQSNRQYTVHLAERGPRIYIGNFRSSRRMPSSHRTPAARYISCSTTDPSQESQNISFQDDRPPPYDVAIQSVPPAYSEVEEQLLNPGEFSREEQQNAESSSNEQERSALAVTTV